MKHLFRNYKISLLTCLFTLLTVQVSTSQEVLPLWEETDPNSAVVHPDDLPTLAVYLPEEPLRTGTAVIVLPGGGYSHLAIDHEGVQVAERLNSMGITAFVLKYRRGVDYPHPVPLGDAQRAIRMVRANASSWEIDPDRIGILGFSAGGHLASTTGTHFDSGDSEEDDPIEQASSRPDFMALIYPVITMVEEFMHTGSRNNLIGSNPDPALAVRMSSERQVTPDTPPAFLVHSSDDAGVPVENSLSFYSALRNAGVPVEMHIYETGPHGFGLAPEDPLLSSWPSLFETWLQSRGLLPGDRD
ncbi:MAG: alpha/beta hydrolase [Balneolaceae bacterium]